MTSEQFVLENRKGDVRQLALQASRYPDVDMPWALDQIRGWQIARTKLPEWAGVDAIIYPPHLSMEQCSSEQTAQYKASIAIGGSTMVDLTGGFGVDLSYIAKNYDRAVYVERQEHLCEIALHNMNMLGLNHIKIVNAEAEQYVEGMEPVDLIFLDPARRSVTGQRTYSIADCTPDVCKMMPTLKQKCHRCMIKLSPMLDWHDAVAQLNKSAGCKIVEQVHIVSVHNECKELLILCVMDGAEDLTIHCVNDGEIFSYQNEKQYQPSIEGNDAEEKALWLLVPNASIMKAGCFDQVTERYHVCQIATNSHLFISKEKIDGFPGKQYAIKAICTMNKKELKQYLAGVTHANIAVRNFPMSADQLRKRLHLIDGGSTYIFATTTAQREHLLYICEM